MPMRTLDTRLSRLIEQRRRLTTRPGRPLPATPAAPPNDEGDHTAMLLATGPLRVHR
jgi:hypothetical protein